MIGIDSFQNRSRNKCKLTDGNEDSNDSSFVFIDFDENQFRKEQGDKIEYEIKNKNQDVTEEFFFMEITHKGTKSHAGNCNIHDDGIDDFFAMFIDDVFSSQDESDENKYDRGDDCPKEILICENLFYDFHNDLRNTLWIVLFFFYIKAL